MLQTTEIKQGVSFIEEGAGKRRSECVCVCVWSVVVQKRFVCFSSTVARFLPNFGEERLLHEFDSAAKWKPVYSLLSGLVGEVRVKITQLSVLYI